jgi:RNA polymerase sigma-70 factor (ECF subfamily)
VSSAPAAFRQQLLGHIPRLRRYARTLVFDAGRADDLVQSALERGLTHWHQFDQQRDMLVWQLSIAHNAHLDQCRRDARMSTLAPADLQELQDRSGGHHGPDVGLQIDLVAALERLSIEQREALLLVCVEQLSYAEVAQVLQVPAGTVMSRVCRARAAMRQFLDGCERPTATAAATGPTLRRVV